MSSGGSDNQRDPAANPAQSLVGDAGHAAESIGELVDAVQASQHHDPPAGGSGETAEEDRAPTDEHPAAPPAGEVAREVVEQGIRTTERGVGLYQDLRRANVRDVASGAHAVSAISRDVGGISGGVGDALGSNTALGRVVGEDASRVIGDVTRVTTAAANVVSRVATVVEDIAGLVGRGDTLPEVEAEFEIADLDVAWTVRQATISEALNEPSRGAIEALCRDEFQARESLGRNAVLTLRRATLTRRVPGVVTRVDDLGTVDQKRFFRFTIATSLWLLSLRQDCRIFQDKNVREIVTAVLRDANLYGSEGGQLWGRVQREYLKREYCVQYNETDLAFISRLLEEEGIAFCIDPHGEHGEQIVFFDRLEGAAEVSLMEGQSIAVRGEEMRTARTESIRHFDWADRLQPRVLTLRDYNFTTPDASQAMTRSKSVPESNGRDVYEYPGRFTLLDENKDSQRNHQHTYPRH